MSGSLEIMVTVKVLKFGTLFSLCSQIKCWLSRLEFTNSKTCLKQPLKKKTKIDFQGQLSLNAGQKYCRKLQGEHSAILLTFIKLLSVIKVFVLSIFESPPKTGFTVILVRIANREDPDQTALLV